jgi:hypothetical protein
MEIARPEGDDIDDLLAALNSEFYNPPVMHQSIVKKRVVERSCSNEHGYVPLSSGGRGIPSLMHIKLKKSCRFGQR